MRIYILLCTFIFGFICHVTYAESKINEYQLPNGLKVLIKEDHRLPVVVTEVWYRVGSSYEPNGITGISHVLEHMMFKGTKAYGPGVFSKIVAENGGEENAFTADDYTAYYQRVEAKKLPISLELEADRMRNLLLSQNEFVKEIEVVKEERRLRTDDNPQSLTYERFGAAANVGSPYHHPVIGWMWDLNHLKVEDVQKWYRTWYAPSNAVLVIVGDVNPKETIKLVRRYFDPLQTPALPVSKTPSEFKDFGERRLVVQTPAKLPLLIMGYNTPSFKTAENKEEAYALVVLSSLLDGGDSARLPTRIVRGKQLASDVDVGYDIFSRLDNIFTITAIPSSGRTPQEVEQAITAEINDLKNKPVDSKELARVKAQIIANKIYEKDSIMNQANEIGALEAVNLSWKDADTYLEQIKKVTPAQIQAVAKKYFSPNKLTVAILKPLPIDAKTQDKPVLTTGGEQNVR